MEEKRPLTVPENAGDAPQQEAAEYEERPGAQQPLTDAAENARRIGENCAKMAAAG